MQEVSMPVILDSEKTSLFIEDIIRNAEEHLSLMLPVFKLSVPLFHLLTDAADRGVNIKILFSSDELEIYEKKAISELRNIEILCCAELNSRCYFNEKNLIITSIDLHSIFENKTGNISIGLNRKEDNSLYEDVLHLYTSLYESSIVLISENKEKTGKPELLTNPYHGFCIRCAMPISFNISKPYCRQCANQFKPESNHIITENYCHLCASKTPTSHNSPLCANCSIV